MESMKCPKCGAEVPVEWQGERVVRCAKCGQGMYAKAHPSTGKSVPVSENTFNEELKKETKYVAAQIYQDKLDTPAFQKLRQGRDWAKEQKRKIEKETQALGNYTSPWKITFFLLVGCVLPAAYYMLGLYTKDDDPVYWGMVVVSTACWFFPLKSWFDQKFSSCFGVIFGWVLALAMGLGVHLGLGLLTVEGTGVMENTALGRGISGAFGAAMLCVWLYYLFVYSRKMQGRIQRIAAYKKESREKKDSFSDLEKELREDWGRLLHRIDSKYQGPQEEIEGDPRSREYKQAMI